MLNIFWLRISSQERFSGIQAQSNKVFSSFFHFLSFLFFFLKKKKVNYILDKQRRHFILILCSSNKRPQRFHLYKVVRVSVTVISALP